MIGLRAVERLEAIGKNASALTDNFLTPDLVLLSIEVVANGCDWSFVPTAADIRASDGSWFEQRDFSQFSADSPKGG